MAKQFTQIRKLSWAVIVAILALAVPATLPILSWNAVQIVAKQEAQGWIGVEWTEHPYARHLPSWAMPESFRRSPEQIYFNGFNEHQEIMVGTLPRLPAPLTLVNIDVGYDSVANRLFASATRVDSLQSLHVFNAALSDSELERLSLLRNLRELTLSGNALTFEGFPRLDKLEELSVDATKPSPSGLKRLLGCPSLKSLSIELPTGADWNSYDWRSPNLEVLVIGYVEMTDEQLKVIAGTIKTNLPKLRMFVINNGELFLHEPSVVVEQGKSHP